MGDVTRVRQILFNLIGNAIKFTDAGEVRITARALPGADGRERLELCVADSRIGMTDKQMARLFQPFGQADSSTTRRYGGTGLGLSIVRRLAELTLANDRRRAPIVALTANALKGEADRRLATGMDGYLTKPLTLDRLGEAVERWMSGRSRSPCIRRTPAMRHSIEASCRRCSVIMPG